MLDESSVFNKELRMETRAGRRHLELAELTSPRTSPKDKDQGLHNN